MKSESDSVINENVTAGLAAAGPEEHREEGAPAAAASAPPLGSGHGSRLRIRVDREHDTTLPDCEGGWTLLGTFDWFDSRGRSNNGRTTFFVAAGCRTSVRCGAAAWVAADDLAHLAFADGDA